MTHTDCCAALALWVLGQHEMARIEAELCEWARLQRLLDDDNHGPLFSAAKPDPVKAQRNYDLAERMQAAINAAAIERGDHATL